MPIFETVELSVRSGPFCDAVERIAESDNEPLKAELMQVLDTDEDSLFITTEQIEDDRVCVVFNPSELLEAMVARI